MLVKQETQHRIEVKIHDLACGGGAQALKQALAEISSPTSALKVNSGTDFECSSLQSVILPSCDRLHRLVGDSQKAVDRAVFRLGGSGFADAEGAPTRGGQGQGDDLHRLKPNGLHTGADNWNKQWRQFFEAHPQSQAEEILGQLEGMMKKFGLGQ